MTAELPTQDDRQAAVAAAQRAFFSDLDVPPGLTLDDLLHASRLVYEWEQDGESTAVPLVLRIYRELSAADRENQQTD